MRQIQGVKGWCPLLLGITCCIRVYGCWFCHVSFRYFVSFQPSSCLYNINVQSPRYLPAKFWLPITPNGFTSRQITDVVRTTMAQSKWLGNIRTDIPPITTASSGRDLPAKSKGRSGRITNPLSQNLDDSSTNFEENFDITWHPKHLFTIHWVLRAAVSMLWISLGVDLNWLYL